MRIKVQKWGNSLAVRLPKAFAREARLSYGTEAALTVEKGKIVIESQSEPEYSLEDLLKGVTKGNLHTETDTGDAMGREAW